MAQNKILIDSTEVKQPLTFEPQWETTYSEDSGRVRAGKAYINPLFTVQSFTCEWGELTPSEASAILQRIVPTPSKPTFQLKYFDWRSNAWTTGTFYVGKGSLKVKTLKETSEKLRGISCNMIGVNKLV